MDRIRVLLVDDHSLFRRGLVSVLAADERLEVVGEAADGLEAIEKAKELTPDVILMDLNMPRCGGLEATSALKAISPQANILVLTVSEKEDDLFAAIKSGAKGYLLKHADPEELLQAVFHVARGGVIVSSDLASKLLGELKTPSGPPKVEAEAGGPTQRETEVLQQVAKGASNREIAAALYISENTVKTHLRNIMDKLHLASRSQAAAYAVRAGLVPPHEER
ncbi:MAG: response regulator transcription factor [Dehalococcoidia bacterium]